MLHIGQRDDSTAIDVRTEYGTTWPESSVIEL